MPESLDQRLRAGRVSRRALLGAGCAGLLGAWGARHGWATTLAAARRGTPSVEGPVFTLGVASGDPRPDGVVLWTRLAPRPLEGGGMPPEPVEVRWEVATDDGFDDVVRKGRATARPDLAHSVHVEVSGLRPAADYFYRFRFGDEPSPVGRTHTLPRPSASPDRLRLAVANCQDFTNGYYAAYRDLVARDLDLVLFLGDYIYEIGIGPARPHAVGGAFSLDEYRTRYAQYRTDLDLQVAHGAVPWVVTWDDHEVANNYAGDISQRDEGPDEFHDRRARAYQAWYEHMPVRLPRPDDVNLRLYRDLAFGDLARIFVLDTRQHADVPPCRDLAGELTDTGPTCPEREDPQRSILGRRQERWLLERLGRADERWSVLANPVMMAGLNVSPGGSPPEYFLDSWDGYPAARTRLVEGLADAPNPIVLTGDYHASFVSDLRADPFDAATPVVGSEFVAPAISSAPFDTDYRSNNPHVRYFDAGNGYLACTVERGQWTSEFRVVSDVRDPAATVATAATFVVERGTPEATPA